MKRMILFIGAAFVPVIILGLLSPDRVMHGPTQELRFSSMQGADIVAFVQEECPHCAAFERFVLEQKWDVEYHEVKSIESQKLFERLQERAPTLQQGVPTVIINGTILQGYVSDEKTGTDLKELLDACQAAEDGCFPFEELLKSDRTVEVTSAAEGMCTEHCETDLDKYVFDLWFIGEVDLTLMSLPALAILLGFLDGFNPCAMWMLITLLTLLIATRDMRKVVVIGGTFLLVSGIMYYLFIAAWLNVFLLIGYNLWVQKIIGLVAIGAGGFYLYEALGKDPNVCSVTSMSRRQKIIEQMKNIASAAAWPAMLLGVSILAISVNMIELVCTAGLPAIFTQILAFNEVSSLTRYGLIGLYILLYMIDDTIIFAIAVVTLHATGLTTKYRRFTLIFGGLLMYVLGLLLIFAPEMLTFQV